MIQQILAIFTVMALLLGLLWFLRRRGLGQFRLGLATRKPHRQLQLLEKLPLSPQHSLYLVQAGARALLIGTSSSGCSILESWQVKPAEAVKGETG